MTTELLAAEERILKHIRIKPRIITFSIIVPAYNEEKGLGIVLEKIFRSVNGNCEVIVVDDGSGDATAEVASGFACRKISHVTNRGKGEALKTGVRHSKGDHVIFIDADDTYPAEVIPQMAEALESCDVVYGSRTNGRDNIPRFNRVGNAIFQNLIKYIYGFKASDYCTGLYGMKKRYLEMMDIKMSQNVLIGLAAFLIALWATMSLDRRESPTAERPSLMEIW